MFTFHSYYCLHNFFSCQNKSICSCFVQIHEKKLLFSKWDQKSTTTTYARACFTLLSCHVTLVLPLAITMNKTCQCQSKPTPNMHTFQFLTPFHEIFPFSLCRKFESIFTNFLLLFRLKKILNILVTLISSLQPLLDQTQGEDPVVGK